MRPRQYGGECYYTVCQRTRYRCYNVNVNIRTLWEIGTSSLAAVPPKLSVTPAFRFQTCACSTCVHSADANIPKPQRRKPRTFDVHLRDNDIKHGVILGRTQGPVLKHSLEIYDCSIDSIEER